MLESAVFEIDLGIKREEAENGRQALQLQVEQHDGDRENRQDVIELAQQGYVEKELRRPAGRYGIV